jgi:YrbI family 3-deoxy-D-manno-octulosonate 8-phosphate phosphatase
MRTVVAYIPVRGGSKSIPRKNIRDLAGRPLLYWTLAAAAECPEIGRVYVGTDDAEIASVAEAFGHPKVSVVSRPAETATDTASTESALLDFAQRHDFDDVVLLQATSPLTTSADVTNALARVRASAADSLVTVVRQRRFLWREVGNGLAEAINYVPAKRPRRQEWSGFLAENGAFYISTRAGLLANRCRLHGKIALYEMAEETYFELDEPSDWLIMAGLLLSRSVTHKNSPSIKLVLTDLDGVLTDGGMYYGESGEELKRFNTRDGKGFELLRINGYHTGIVTGENTLLNARRAKKLRIDILEQGAEDKVSVIERLLGDRGLVWGNVAYIGDDVNDIEVMKRAGFTAAPADAEPAVLSIVNHVCKRNGGRGCFREFAEVIMMRSSTALPER